MRARLLASESAGRWRLFARASAAAAALSRTGIRVVVVRCATAFRRRWPGVGPVSVVGGAVVGGGDRPTFRPSADYGVGAARTDRRRRSARGRRARCVVGPTAVGDDRAIIRLVVGTASEPRPCSQQTTAASHGVEGCRREGSDTTAVIRPCVHSAAMGTREGGRRLVSPIRSQLAPRDQPTVGYTITGAM
uniref:Uncharacterized protein n=1 Tax=Plectus sambesii TaxID=2011161 RepID=A0A914W9L2_9BILA